MWFRRASNTGRLRWKKHIFCSLNPRERQIPVMPGRQRSRSRFEFWIAVSASPPVKPVIPPHRFGEGVRDGLGVGMRRVDQEIALQPRRDGGNDQERRALLLAPLLAEVLADALVSRVPAGMRRGLEDLIGNPVRNGDRDEVLV